MKFFTKVMIAYCRLGSVQERLRERGALSGGNGNGDGRATGYTGRTENPTDALK